MSESAFLDAMYARLNKEYVNPPSMDVFSYDGEDVSINGDILEIGELNYHSIYWNFIDSKIVGLHCYYCKKPVSAKKYEERFFKPPIFLCHSGIGSHCLHLNICSNCGHWTYEVLMSDGENKEDEFICNSSIYSAKLKVFEDHLHEDLKDEMASHMRINPKYWNQISPRNLELFVTDIFKSVDQNAKAYHVGRPDDDGIDVVYIDCEEKTWLIQVKRRQYLRASEGVGTLRSLLGAMTVNSNKYGIAVSTADYFTHRAFEFSKRAKKVGMTINLVDRHMLDKMLDPLIYKNNLIKALDAETSDPDIGHLFSEALNWYEYNYTKQLKLDF